LNENEKTDRGYQPKPIDTSAVKLPHELDKKIEELARNNHEVWAQERRQGGWKHGPERNDTKKEHPGLLPYEQLSETEKDVDRETVEQTLKAAVALGCKIRVADSMNPKIRAESSLSGDDMADWPRLPPGFEQPKQDLLMAYLAADAEARWRFRQHKIAVVLSAVFGTAAVIAAIIELAIGENPYPRYVEVFCAALAAVAVGLGIGSHFMKKWLLERHRAERCRFAKYRVLVQLAAAGDEPAAVGACLKEFECLIRQIHALDDEDLEEFMEEDPIPDDPPEVHGGGKVQHKLQELVEHYVKQRLQAQAKYFFTQSRKKGAVDAWVKLIPPFLFFFSIVFALVHFASAALDHFAWFKKHLGAYLDSERLVFCAALFPVFGSGVRLLRSAFEYSRNTVRYRAKYRALEQLMIKLESASHPNQIVHSMWKGEMILEQEHREWLRLMTEAEWFG